MSMVDVFDKVKAYELRNKYNFAEDSTRGISFINNNNGNNRKKTSAMIASLLSTYQEKCLNVT